MSDEQTLTEIKSYINAIDFSPVIERLMKDNRWKQKRAEEAVRCYKQFIFLQRKYFDELSCVPSKEIDEVWHAHILFTKQYHQDCHNIFGTYLHHQPETSFGVFTLTAEDNDKNALETERLYLREFGEYIYGEPLEWPAFIQTIIKWVKWFKAPKLAAGASA